MFLLVPCGYILIKIKKNSYREMTDLALGDPKNLRPHSPDLISWAGRGISAFGYAECGSQGCGARSW